MAVTVWLSVSVALVWRHGDWELALLFLAVFAGILFLASLVYAAGYLAALAVRRWVERSEDRRWISIPAKARLPVLVVSAVAGLLLVLAASLPVVSVTADLLAVPVQASGSNAVPEYTLTTNPSPRGLLPLMAAIRAATETSGFGQPQAAARPPQLLLPDTPPAILIDPIAALGILAALESGIALLRRGRAGLTGHALVLTGLAGLAYLASLPYWVSALTGLALNAEAQVIQSVAERLSFGFVTDIGYWAIALLSLLLVVCGVLLNLRSGGAQTRS